MVERGAGLGVDARPLLPVAKVDFRSGSGRRAPALEQVGHAQSPALYDGLGLAAGIAEDAYAASVVEGYLTARRVVLMLFP